MTGFNVLQLVLAAVALTIAVRRLHVLWGEASLDADAFVDALDTALASGELELARRLAAACTPAWPARLAADALGAGAGPPDRVGRDSREFALAAWRGRATLVTLARMAGPLALIGVILELGNATHDSGLAALQRGLPLHLAIERSLLTFAIGLGTTLVCVASAKSVAREARSLERALTRVAAALERAAEPGPRDM